MKNWHRWTLAVILGFVAGICTVASVQPNAPWVDPWAFLKGGMIGMAPAVAALKMTLENADGTR